ncbi:hypothetical protein [Furfurilactobacillus curtus]|uniref:Membrane protein n=1 Tax=Furfurilactobacillus curtus TaxID=1746200 RepID=A0ABQ5JQX3_9LACO
MQTKSRWQTTLLINLGFLVISLVMFMALVHGSQVFATGDYHFHQNRIESLYEAMRHGNFLPRVDAFFAGGYGYAASLFYPTLFIYLPASMRLIGFSSAQVYFGMLIGVLFATMSVTEWAGRQLNLSRQRSVIFALLYGLSTYHLQDLFSRQDLGEAVAMVFFPLVLASLIKLRRGDHRAWLLLAIGMAAIGYAHMLSLEMMTLFCGLYVLSHGRQLWRQHRVRQFFWAANLAGLLLAAYLIPVGEQLLSQTFQVTSTPLVYISHEAVPLSSLIENSLSNQVFHASTVNVGPIILLGSLLTLVMAFRQDKNRDLALMAMALLFMTTTLFPWTLVDHTFFNTLQFPWRLFSLISLLVAFDLADLNVVHVRYYTRGLVILTGLVTILLGLRLSQNTVAASPKRVESATAFNRIDSYYIGSGHEYLPKGLSYSDILDHKKRVLIYDQEDVTITAAKTSAGHVVFRYQVHNQRQRATITLPLVYYKGMQAINQFDHQLVTTTENQRGLTKVNVSGSGVLKVGYAGTNWQQVSGLISLVTSLFIGLEYCWHRWHRRFRTQGQLVWSS